MKNNLIIIDNNIIEYKIEIENFYKLIKSLYLEIDNINNNKNNILLLKSNIINNELDLKNNKVVIDSINLFFKELININREITAILNKWKSNFAGKKGLEFLIKDIKEKLILPFKQEQLKYDLLIKEKINNEEITLKEQSKIKTTIGIRTYKKLIIDEINIDLLDKKYLMPNETWITLDIKQNNNIIISGVKYHFEEIKK